jgi:hypothetical protein
LALEQVLVAFLGVTTGWAARVVSGRSGEECLAGWEEFETELEVKDTEFVASSEGCGEGFPVH